jgi:hypothetical protein
VYAQGIDNMTACSGAANPYATMACVKAPKGVGVIPDFPDLEGITGPAYACADNIYDAFSGLYTGFE